MGRYASMMQGLKARYIMHVLDQAEVQQCMDAGMDAFVPKPFKQEELVVAIAKALGPT